MKLPKLRKKTQNNSGAHASIVVHASKGDAHSVDVWVKEACLSKTKLLKSGASISGCVAICLRDERATTRATNLVNVNCRHFLRFGVVTHANVVFFERASHFTQ